jgi:Flp pilus assembly protein TadG
VKQAMKSRPRRSGGRDQRGAAAVEFALVLPVLLVIVFGIIDYGLVFNNALNARQGVREAARQGVVGNFSMTGCTTGTSMAQLVCKTNKQVAPVAGTAYTMVKVPGTWTRGATLIVCTQVKNTGTTGFVPLPANGIVRSKTQMSIETEAPTTAPVTTSDTAPAGADWTWCS